MPKELITAQDYVNKAKSALGNGHGTLILAIIGVALSTASAFTFCLASIGFDFTQLTQTAFWSRWASMFIAMISTYGFVLLHKDDKNKLNKWYTDKNKLLLELSISTGFDFDKYLEIFNEERRITYFKYDIQKKIAKANAKIIRLKLKNKPYLKYENKIKVYSIYVTDDYISANKQYLKTHSKPIRSSQVLTESKQRTGIEENFLSSGKYYGSKVTVKMALSLVTTATFSSVFVQNFETGINAASIVMTLFTMLSIVLSIISAIFAANGCYKNVYVPNLLFKLKILKGYAKWKGLSDMEKKLSVSEDQGAENVNCTEKNFQINKRDEISPCGNNDKI